MFCLKRRTKTRDVLSAESEERHHPTNKPKVTCLVVGSLPLLAVLFYGICQVAPASARPFQQSQTAASGNGETTASGSVPLPAFNDPEFTHLKFIAPAVAGAYVTYTAGANERVFFLPDTEVSNWENGGNAGSYYSTIASTGEGSIPLSPNGGAFYLIYKTSEGTIDANLVVPNLPSETSKP